MMVGIYKLQDRSLYEAARKFLGHQFVSRASLVQEEKVVFPSLTHVGRSSSRRTDWFSLAPRPCPTFDVKLLLSFLFKTLHKKIQ